MHSNHFFLPTEVSSPTGDRPDDVTVLHQCACLNVPCEAEEIPNSCPELLDAINDKKKSALHDAASRGYDDMMRLLVRCNADVTLLDKHGKTALDYAFKGIALNRAAST